MTADYEFWKEIRRALLIALRAIDRRFGFGGREPPANK
jgi:hypothetical protein